MSGQLIRLYVCLQSVGILSLVNLVASVAAAFGAVMVLPSWSADELNNQAADLLKVTCHQGVSRLLI